MLNNVEEILDFAIQEEIQAAEFYKGMVAKCTNAHMKEVFEGFALEEEGHRCKLEAVKAGNLDIMEPREKPLDLKIVDYLNNVDPFRPDMDFQQALVVAMKKEKAAFLLYSSLAKSATDEKIKTLFLALAQEEAKHKLRFELEYEDGVMMWM